MHHCEKLSFPNRPCCIDCQTFCPSQFLHYKVSSSSRHVMRNAPQHQHPHLLAFDLFTEPLSPTIVSLENRIHVYFEYMYFSVGGRCSQKRKVQSGAAELHTKYCKLKYWSIIFDHGAGAGCGLGREQEGCQSLVGTSYRNSHNTHFVGRNLATRCHFQKAARIYGCMPFFSGPERGVPKDTGFVIRTRCTPSTGGTKCTFSRPRTRRSRRTFRLACGTRANIYWR